jgi:cobalt-zinc-cadmium efflux system outer membrane protein
VRPFFRLIGDPLRVASLMPLLILLWCGAVAFAEETHHDENPSHDPIHHVHGSHPECPLPKGPMDILRCAQEEHPDVKRAKLASDASQTLTEVAGQLPNPELEVQSVFGRTLGDNQMQTQISLKQPIGLGGKRSARIHEAEAEQKQTQADLRQVQAEVILKTVRNLHRLRQLETEKETLDEAISAYAKLVSQYRGRPRLTPEQEVSLSVYEMAQADNRIKRAALLEEEREIGHFFHISTGHGLDELKPALPQAPTPWPEPEARKASTPASPALFRLTADQELALSQQELARADSWPNFQIGPMVQLQDEGPIRGQLYGVHLVMDLPFLSLNGGGRAHAAKALSKAEKSIDLLNAEETHERAEQVRIYQNATTALKEAGSLSSIERKHARVEALSFRGLISSSLVIEAHRQRAELQKNRNERELRAIEALWTVYKLDGRIFEEKL